MHTSGVTGWRLFQTKQVGSFFLVDLLSGSLPKGMRQGPFRTLSSSALLIMNKGEVRWYIGQRYWVHAEQTARQALKVGNVQPELRRAAKDLEAVLASVVQQKKQTVGQLFATLQKNAENVFGLFLGPFESVLPELLGAELTATKSKIEKGRWIRVLSQPEKLTFYGRFQKDMLALAGELQKRTPASWNSVQKLKSDSTIATKIKRLYVRYRVLPVDVSGKPWDEDFFWKQLLLTAKKYRSESAKFERARSEIALEKQHIVKKSDVSPRARALASVAADMALVRDMRKSLISHVAFQIRKFLAITALHTGVPLEDLSQYAVDEVARLLKTGKKVPAAVVQQRRVLVAVVVRSKGNEILTRAAAQKALREVQVARASSTSIIAGQIGNPGKTVRGRVRLVVNQDDAHKMKQGEVLVAVATNYDLVPFMKKAKAIVTDEGGLLSHAAIVSRELGIPCVIGTKVATQVFSDSDLIEVDASEGNVRKIA